MSNLLNQEVLSLLFNRYITYIILDYCYAFTQKIDYKQQEILLSVDSNAYFEHMSIYKPNYTYIHIEFE